MHETPNFSDYYTPVIHTLGEKRQTIVTLADKLMVTDMVVILRGV